MSVQDGNAPTTALTPEEVRFFDQYVHELHQAVRGPATLQPHARGIFIDPWVFNPFFQFWGRDWMARPISAVEPYPPAPDPGVLCPWPDRAAFLARSGELGGMLSIARDPARVAEVVQSWDSLLARISRETAE